MFGPNNACIAFLDASSISISVVTAVIRELIFDNYKKVLKKN
jgi:hypothetical protein